MQSDSGVYQILNCQNGKSYIGSSVNIQQRWSAHRSLLNKGQHPNIHFQRSWKRQMRKDKELEEAD